MDRYNKYYTKQLNAQTYTCTHNIWWLVLGWVTTKEYHPRLCIDYVDFMARYKCNYIYIYIYICVTLYWNLVQIEQRKFSFQYGINPYRSNRGKHPQTTIFLLTFCYATFHFHRAIVSTTLFIYKFLTK